MVDAVRPFNKDITNVNIDEQKYIKPDAGAIIGGVVAGLAVQSFTGITNNLAAFQIMKKMRKISNSLSADEFIQVEKAVADTIKNSGLEAKGVSIIKATKENAEEISKIMAKEAEKGICKYLPHKIKERLCGNILLQVESGNNVFYAIASKELAADSK